jgi:diguanylate cyclase
MKLMNSSTQIEKEPNILFQKDIQDQIEEFINKRFERDKKVVVERTSDISKLVVLMEEYLNDAISSNGSGSKLVSKY